jgi:outer membrane protein OmpA-like peptidoglycan-associated protein
MKQGAPKQKLQQSRDNAAAMDELKSLLLGPEQEEISHLRERIDDPTLRAGDLAEVLPESVRLSTERDNELTNALETPVSECIKRSAKRNPELFAESFYPVISPAIRKSIAEALRGLVKQINQTLDHSFSVKGMRWRLEAMRSGVPFSEVVLRHTLAFRVEQVLLIQPESGLLIQHIAAPQVAEQDPDAVSAMLTAIGNFVREAFLAGQSDQSLDTVDMGEYTVLLLHGPKAYLACVVRGIPPMELREHCHTVLEKIHRLHGRALAEFSGDRESVQGVVPLLESCLLSEQKEQEKSRGMSPVFAILLLLIIAGIGWSSYRGYTEWEQNQALQARFNGLVSTLDSTPGLIVTETRQQKGHLSIRGLRDNLAPDPRSLIKRHNLADEEVDIRFQPYQDLTPPFVRQRLNNWLDAPAGVVPKVNDNGVLSLEGVASEAWIARTRALASVTPGITALDTSNLVERDQALLQEATRLLQPPADVRLSVEQTRLSARGVAPVDWIQSLQTLPGELPGLGGIDAQVTPREQLDLEQVSQRLVQEKVLFLDGVAMTENQDRVLDGVATDIGRILALCGKLQLRPEILIIGRTDAIGLQTNNLFLATARARTVYEQLVERGLPGEIFRLTESVPVQIEDTEDYAERRVEFKARYKPVVSTEQR